MALRCECDLIGCDGSHCVAKALPKEHTCHDINPPFPGECLACSDERSVYPTAIHYELEGPAGGASGDALQKSPQSTGALLKCPDEIALRVSQRASELPRRNTTAHWPHILLVTIEELQFIVTDEINKALGRREEAPLDHYFTPDQTNRFCTICGDTPLGSVWGIHRFQIQPGDPSFDCACGHKGGDHAQFRYSCFVKDCACVQVHGRLRR